MDIEKIKNSKTIVTGKNILYFKQIASTQLEAGIWQLIKYKIDISIESA